MSELEMSIALLRRCEADLKAPYVWRKMRQTGDPRWVADLVDGARILRERIRFLHLVDRRD